MLFEGRLENILYRDLVFVVCSICKYIILLYNVFIIVAFTQDIINLACQWTFDPITVEIEPDRVATSSVDQRVYLVASRERFSVLVRILRDPTVSCVIIFANRRDQVRRLFEKLRSAGIECGMLSGEITQSKRTRTLDNFKTGKTRVLVATDVAGRGIHVEGISHVINYNLPEDPEDYVHRIGRTGRAGATGVSISFASEDDDVVVCCCGCCC